MKILTRRDLVGRAIDEKNRAATPLELFYDLIYVVAIANTALAFHHGYAESHIGHAVISFFMVFMAVWWAWNQYTWFASSFDNDSVYFRLCTFWQMIGALIIAAGAKSAFEGDWSTVVIGYVVIRISAVLLWLKVAQDSSEFRVTALRYAVGIFLCQVGWVTQTFFEFSFYIFLLLWLAEFIVPIFAESHTQTSFHSEHIEERFGLLTIIVLGESILAISIAFTYLIEHISFGTVLVSAGGVFTLFGMWWLYFNSSVEHRLRSRSIAFLWGYGHYLIFTSAAATGALISVNVDVLSGHGEISVQVANFGFAVAVAVYLFGLWFCQERFIAQSQRQAFPMLIAAGLALILGLLSHSVVSIGVLVVCLVCYRQYKPLE